MNLRQTSVVVLVVALVASAACVKKPPVLTPQANSAFNKTQIIRAADLLRDVVITAADFKQEPLTPQIAKQVVIAHQSILMVIQASDEGWQQTVDSILSNVVRNIPDEQARERVAPYVSLTQAILHVIVNRDLTSVSDEVIAAYMATLTNSLTFDAQWLAAH